MTIERRNPPGLHPTPGYHHVTSVEAARLVFLAGQCPLDADGRIAPDLLGQTDQIVANTLLALEDAGATPEDVVRTVIYVASSERAELSAVWDRLTGSALGRAFSTASTLLGVTCLGFPGQLVELDVTAALA
ncbi:enamine deaminase RidA (YjgF/YER057c/UK114 family) [Amycolatopsis bartoniae]|uniref:Enamine deaminase RidA n=1 Tax=Amycolatopsis bartoniae TaxID=941986 RepID=A0A8H9MD32_9PSEU|nr:RidA family protein [Amycolatopsis bartoniae]MBB2934254.1 enamine deaminase RidA (YjgF/YER057c/UK114 family) [Amycolatopsis bartoniae]TVT08459.1 RidA family protein [Amycolatopsis bartoniae]GHF48749.1 enamine deaminase RidA [Amycolatopsis bartoniae]